MQSEGARVAQRGGALYKGTQGCSCETDWLVGKARAKQIIKVRLSIYNFWNTDMSKQYLSSIISVFMMSIDSPVFTL